MKIDFKLYPGLRLLIIAFLGALFGILFNFNHYVLIGLLCLTVITLFGGKFKTISYYFTIFCLGIWFVLQINKINPRIPDKIYQEFPALIQGTIIKTLKISDTQAKVIIEGDFDAKPLPFLHNQKVLLTVYGLKYKNPKLKTGMKIFADVKARTPRKPQLPTDFPENNYAASLDIKWLATASSRNIAVVEPARGFLHLIDKQVQSIQSRINKLFSAKSAPIVTALLTGDKTKIPYETKQLFSLSGTAHILAVSGLHVGIIATIIFFLLGFVRNNWLKFIIFTLMLSAFVIISGLQPSALRAGLMAILFVYAKTLQRHSNPLNIIAIAVLLILIVSPELIYSAGFQMSVAAIAGIFVMLEPIKKMFKLFFKTDNTLLNFIISSISLTLSASIIVSPLVAYYFKVYSIVSPLANLLVIPLMTLGMCFSIIALILSYIYMPIAGLYAVSTDFLITLSQSINKWAVGLPSAFLSGDNLVLLSVFISLGLLYITFSNNNRQIIFRLGVSVIIALISIPLTKIEDIHKLKIYPREQYVAIDLPIIDNNKSIIIIDRKPAQKPKYDFAMINHLKEQQSPLSIYYSGNAGLSIVDKLKHTKKINFVEMDVNFQMEIQKLLKIDKFLPQIISTKINE